MKILTDEQLRQMNIESYCNGSKDTISMIKAFIDSVYEDTHNKMKKEILNEIQAGK